MRQANLNKPFKPRGSRKKCHCGKQSLTGLNRPLCRYHYNVVMYDDRWADLCELPGFVGTEADGTPRFAE